MKKINYKLKAEIIVPIVLGIFFLSYGNKTSHPSINHLIVKTFLSKNNKEGFSMNKFKNYKFDFTKPKLAGNKIIKSGYFNPSEVPNIGDISLVIGKETYGSTTYTEAERELSPLGWIEHGGYSADEPEVPASLRHFYDPTRKKGKRYLTDKLNSKVFDYAESFLVKPHTNGVDWALGTTGNFGVLEHIYTWENGKKYVQGALETANSETRKKFMAKAWRSLGETLHMIADNGCPAHVRNDGHPSIPISLLSYFGNPDPYEEQMAVSNIADFDGGPVPKDEIDKFRAAKTTRDIAHQLAVFTNKNFFTNETISGTDWKGNNVKPITHPEYVYKAPKLSPDQYDGTYYSKEIADGISIKMCTDVQYFLDVFAYKSYPYLDEECVESQARVLIPIIKEAGVNVTKLFIPKLDIVIKSLDDEGNIKGEIVHETDREYKNKISYNGPVNIEATSTKKLATIQASNGRFEGKINVDEETTAFAEIEFGGISVHSNDFKIKVKEKKEKEKDTTDEVKKSASKRGYWKLSESIVTPYEEENSECYTYSISLSDGSFSYQRTGTCQKKPDPFASKGNWTAPPDKLIPGENYPMNCSVTRTQETWYYSFNSHISLYMDDYQSGCGSSRSPMDISEDCKISSMSKHSDATASWSGTFEAPSHDNENGFATDKFQIKAQTTSGCVRYIYEWNVVN